MNLRNYIMATAGHVDHGKSSLVKALTGIDPDRLPEEKARGITIDLGFAHLDLQAEAGGEKLTYHVGIVDVPGHEDFVKNMVAGVGSIDLALLVVAADDGWMPQTDEHLQILDYLGVARGVVALSKIDLATDEQQAIREVRNQLANSSLADAPIVPTSIVSGRGLAELKQALTQTLQSTPLPRDFGKPRLSVDRVFILRGIGSVVTGTTTGGRFVRGAEIVVQPSGATGRVRSVQNHNRDVEASSPGTRTALNIPDVQGPALQRGDVITLPHLKHETSDLGVLLKKSGRTPGSQTRISRPIKNRARVRIHLGSTNVAGHIIFLDQSDLNPGESAIARLRLEEKLHAFVGDRFIVRDWSEQTTLAGGTVLDVEPLDDKVKSEAQLGFLRARAAAPDDLETLLHTELQRRWIAPKERLFTLSRFSDTEITAALNKLIDERKLLLRGSSLVFPAFWDDAKKRATQRIRAEHKAHPNRVGLTVAELKTELPEQIRTANLFDDLLAELLSEGFVLVGSSIKQSSHQLTLPPALQSAGANVRSALSTKPFDPPSRKEIAPDAPTQQALRYLLETGEATLLNEDVVLLSTALQKASDEVKRFLHAKRAATASELRQALGTSRRVIIPLLEHLDRAGLTHRDGDKRILR
ncbi:MAG TPA: selenocysteine-specific translation elongation factor [Verrucomicrobiae bacterium]